MNLLVSTTLVWNPGDDFIRYGCLYLMERALGIRAQTHIYDRNARISKAGAAESTGQANLWAEGDPVTRMDAVLVAGTPDWARSNHRLYAAAKQAGLPVYALGLGAENEAHLESHVDEMTLETLRHARCVTTRDILAHSFLAERGVPNLLLPCPALFAPAYLRALGFAARKEHPKSLIVSSDVRAPMAAALELWHADPAGQDMLCHSSYEFKHLSHAVPGLIYDADPHRLLARLLEYSTVTSGRLHAALPALAEGAQVELLPGVSQRIRRGFEQARLYLGHHSLSHLENEYLAALARPA